MREPSSWATTMQEQAIEPATAEQDWQNAGA
jgi:hypothetical protein